MTKAHESLRVHVQGAGKVGTTLGRLLRKQGYRVTLRPHRGGLPERLRADVVLLSVRDSLLAEVAQELAQRSLVEPDAVVLHLAGALGPEVLSPLQGLCRGIGQMHPMVAFAARDKPPTLHGAHVLVDGTDAAVREASAMARALGMVPRRLRVERAAYHAAAVMVAGGALGLASAAADLLEASGIDRKVAARMLGPLLRSAGENLDALGMPEALTGVVRRADSRTLDVHIDAWKRRAPRHLHLYVMAIRAQLPMAREIAEASPAAFDTFERRLANLEMYLVEDYVHRRRGPPTC